MFIKGSVGSITNLPSAGMRQGDAYYTEAGLYIYDGSLWVAVGTDGWVQFTIRIGDHSSMFRAEKEIGDIFEDLDNPRSDELKMFEVLYPSAYKRFLEGIALSKAITQSRLRREHERNENGP